MKCFEIRSSNCNHYLAVCISEQSLGETSRPVNLAAAKDEKVQLNCSTQDQENGYWKYTKPFEINERKIYYGDKVVNGMSSLFSVNDSVQGHFNLIFNALESTSGRYTCQPDVESTDQSAEVIVLGKYILRIHYLVDKNNIQFSAGLKHMPHKACTMIAADTAFPIVSRSLILNSIYICC